MVSLAPADLAVIGVFCAAVIAIGVFTARSSIRDVEFLLAGRSLTTPIFVMSLVSSWYGGILGVGEFSYRFGISNWFLQGFPYYVFAIVFAFLLAKRVRATNLLSIPDKLNQAYGKKTALLGSVLTFILMTPAPYVLMVGVLIELVTGWPIALAVAAGTLASVVYLFAGGFRADINTNVFEFFMMFIGFGVILPYAALKYGGPLFIASHVPPLHLTWNGGNSIQFVLVWFFIALWTLVDPSFHQRCYAARTGEVARRGILVAVVFWAVFDVMTTTAGLYARAALPDIASPVMAYPLLAEAVLPPVAKGLFYVGMLAAIMSTLNSQSFVSAMTLGRDIVARLRDRMGENATTGSVRWGILLTALLSVALALAIPSVIRLWYTIGTVVIPGLLIPLVASYFDRVRPSPRTAFGSMALGWIVASAWLIAGWSKEMGSSDYYPLGIEPMYAGLAASAAVWGAGIARRRRNNIP
ncbi:MAG TPA: sodium:solute symporter family protein [Bacteroidota bacterium]|nr:sodium:solute symporter family protein [Bacteroidota bacterium]